MTTSINTDSRICVLATWEDCLFESEVAFVLLELVFFPNISRKKFWEQRFGPLWEDRKSCQLTRIQQVRSTHRVLTRSLRCSLSYFESSLILLGRVSLISKILLWSFIVWNWCISILIHSTLSAWTWFPTTSWLSRWLNISSIFRGRISRQIHRAISALWLFLEDSSALVSNKLAVRPVATLHLGEDAHALVAHFKCSDSGNLLEVRASFILVLDQVVVEIKVEVRFRNLVLHHNGVWNSFDDGSSLSLEELNVFSFVVPRAPGVFFAILAALDHEYWCIGIDVLCHSKRECKLISKSLYYI